MSYIPNLLVFVHDVLIGQKCILRGCCNDATLFMRTKVDFLNCSITLVSVKTFPKWSNK